MTVFLAGLLCFLLPSVALSANAPMPDDLKKVGFINGLQGTYDSQIIITLLHKKGILFEEMGSTWTPLNKFLRPLGALVVSGDPWWARKPEGWPAALSDEDLESLHSWIQDGGQVLFIHNGALMLRTKKKGGNLAEWLGFSDLGATQARPLAKVVIPQPRNPFILHFADKGKRPWMFGGYITTGMSQGEAVIDLTGNKDALLYVGTVGRGKIVHFGRQTFRFIERPKDPAQEALNEEAIREQQGILRAVVEQWPNLTTARAVLLARERQLQCRERLFLWYREPDHDPNRSDEPRLFHDPAPRAEEELKQFTLDVGRNEYESFFFYLTNFGPKRDLSVTVSDLTGPSDQKMPAGQLQVRVQSSVLTAEPKPAPKLRGAERTIWLYRPVQLPPVGRESFAVGELEHRVVWITLAPWQGPAGIYRSTIEIRAGEQTALTIPLVVTVFDVPVQHDLISLFNNINSVTLLPGAPINGNVTDTAKYNAYLQLLRDYGCDLAELYGPANPRHHLPVIRGTDLTLPEALKRKPELLKRETLPALDFSWFTPSLKPVAVHGFRGLFSRSGFGPPFSVEELQSLYEDNSLTWSSPQGRRLFQWYLSEWTKYVRALGFDGQRLRYFDELDEKGDEAVKEYLDFQSVAQAAGFKTGSTFQFYSSTQRDRIQQLNPATSCWMLQAGWSLGFYEATDHLKTIDPTDEILLYGWRWENYTYYGAHEELWRVFYPIAGAAHRIGFYYAGLIRPPHFATVVEDDRGFIVAAAMEAYRDALDTMKLYRALLLARSKMGVEQRTALERELSKVVNIDADALIRLEHGVTDRKVRSYESRNIPILRTVPDVTLNQYRQAKRRLLELSAVYDSEHHGLRKVEDR